MNTEELNKEFSKLNKEYIALDKSLNTATESESFSISDKMDAIQVRMCEISALLEG